MQAIGAASAVPVLREPLLASKDEKVWVLFAAVVNFLPSPRRANRQGLAIQCYINDRALRGAS
eukprot:4872465-Lingulodinium_polyedra.AAC.1